MPGISAGNLILRLTALWRRHDMQHILVGIDDQVVIDGAHAWEFASNLFRSRLLLSIMHGPAQAHRTQPWINTNGKVARAGILPQRPRQVSRELIIANQVTLDL